MTETVPVLMERAKALQASMRGWSAPNPEAKSRQAALVESLHSLLAELAAAPQSPDPETMRQWTTRLHLLQAEFQEMLMPPKMAVKAVVGLSGLTLMLFLLGVALHTFLLQHQEGAGGRLTPEDRVAILMGMSAVAALWGALGSATSALVNVSRLYSEGMLTFNDLVDQFTKPLRGAFVGGIIFLLVQGGVLEMNTAAGTPLGEQHSFVIFALSGLSGLYEHGFMEKTRVILGALLGTEPKRNGQA
ncbi:MAG: hypothetical protein ACOY94_20390 [Bacillota bacterium]